MGMPVISLSVARFPTAGKAWRLLGERICPYRFTQLPGRQRLDFQLLYS